MTLIADKLEKLDMRREDYAFGAQVMEYAKKGGTLERALQIVRDAFQRMPGKGHPSVAIDGQSSSARPRQPAEGAVGHGGDAISAKLACPPRLHPHREREAATTLPLVSAMSKMPPAREPTLQQRNIGARNATRAAITIMDTLKIDGTPIGDWSIALARVEGKRKTREGYILREASRYFANAPANAKIRDVLSVGALQSIQQKAAEFADVA